MPVLIIGWGVYDTLPEKEKKEFTLVANYETPYFYECYEYEHAKGNINYEWSDRCFKSQEELLEFFGYEVIEDLDADAGYVKRLDAYAEEDLKNWMQLSKGGN